MANTASKKRLFLDWVSLQSACLFTCYGTLAMVALFSVIGISIEIDVGLLVKLLTGLLVLALASMGYSYKIHRVGHRILMGLSH